MRYFSFKLAFLAGFAHLMAVLTLGMMIFMSALGRTLFRVAPRAHPRPPAPANPAYENAFSILVHPAAWLLPEFQQLPTPVALGVAALNSLAWGVAAAVVIGLIRRVFGGAKKPASEPAPIVE
jgi:hypothetical protein